MRTELLIALATLILLLYVSAGVAADESPFPPELNALSSRIEAKAAQGKKTEAEFADELKALDAMLARHQGEKTDDVAWMLFVKARMYDSILTNRDTLLTNKAKAEALNAQLKRDFPKFEPSINIKLDFTDLKRAIILAPYDDKRGCVAQFVGNPAEE